MARPKHCVLIVRCADWEPVFYHDIPPRIDSAEFYTRSVPLRRALTVAQEYNKAHSPSKPGKYDGTWAVVVHGLKRQHPAARGQLSERAPREAKGGA